MEPRTNETTAERRRIESDTLTFDSSPLSIQQDEDSFNPYERRPVEKSGDKKTVKRDLRKLSEWIKTMRAVEEKKTRGEG